MSQTLFDLLAQGMRYWFAALAVYILFRVVVSVWREFSRERGQLRQTSGEYAMGILEVVAPRDNPKILGTRFALRRENKIGRSGSCDIRIKDRSLSPVQAMIYQKGNQIFLSDYGTRNGVGLNGHRIRADVALLDGDEIQLAKVVLLLHVKGGQRRKPQYAQDDYRSNQQADMRNWPYQSRSLQDDRVNHGRSTQGRFDAYMSDDDDPDQDEYGEYDDYDPDEDEYGMDDEYGLDGDEFSQNDNDDLDDAYDEYDPYDFEEDEYDPR